MAGRRRRYQRAWLRWDLLAGLTTAAVVVPQAVAYASLAGLPVQVGCTWPSCPWSPTRCSASRGRSRASRTRPAPTRSDADGPSPDLSARPRGASLPRVTPLRSP
jgi:hypothetical protein